VQQTFSELLRGYKRKSKCPQVSGRFCKSLTPFRGNDEFGQETDSQECGWSSAQPGIMKTYGARARWLTWLGMEVGQALLK